MKAHTLIFLLILPSVLTARPNQRTTIPEYIQTFQEIAVDGMQKNGIPASITLAQGILESDAGNSDLAREANNHFGIKCHKDWTGPTFIKDDDAKDECFRKYNHALESYADHGRFLKERPRYAFLFELDPTDYKAWAHGLKKAGYATNPQYATTLIRVIEEYELYHYDRGRTSPVVEAKQNKVESAPAPVVKKAHPRETKHARDRSRMIASRQNTYAANAQGVPYVKAGKADSWYTIAVANDMRLWQVLKYNDADKNEDLKEGDIVYLKPKRGNPPDASHTVMEGETLRMIAQLHGVKLARLIKLNGLENDITLKPGQNLKLR